MTSTIGTSSITHSAAPHARRGAFAFLAAAILVCWPATASAQLDPLLFLKRSMPTVTTVQHRANVLLAVDTAPRMQYDGNGNYYDPADYAVGNPYDAVLGVSGVNTTARYRRVYHNLAWSGSGPQTFNTNGISIVGDRQSAAYTSFYLKSRLGAARAAMAQAITENGVSSRFGLIKMRQTNPRIDNPADSMVYNSNAAQAFPTDGAGPTYWRVFRGFVSGDNRSLETATAPLVRPDSANANSAVLGILGQPVGSSSGLLAAGNDSAGVDDAPLAHMLDDVRAEAARLIAADAACMNTVAVLITGGGEGTGGHTPSAMQIASTFTGISGRRVPIYVIAIAPPAASVVELRAIAIASGGMYFEVPQSEIDLAAAAGKPAPTAVRGINTAIQHAFAKPADVNAPPTASLPYGPLSEFQVTSPVVGTVNLVNHPKLPSSETYITNDESGAVIPQRANVMVTTAFALPGFEARLRAFRVYKPEVDVTKPSGYKFTADGTALWVAQTPTADYCNDATASCRNIYTALPDGTVVAFKDSNAATLSSYLDTWDAAGLINFVRRQPLGAVVSSTPAFMDPPSLDPPPDEDYPAFVDANKERRSLIFVGANDGMIHAIDGRTGYEVWAFIPFNLLPKLKTLRDGQSIDAFEYFMDSSGKVADVKIGSNWRTMVIFGQGAGGTFYQAFDATLDNMALSVAQDSDSVTSVLSFFSDPGRIELMWAFPRYSVFDWKAGQYGDVSLAFGATDHERSVGQTWSDPAVGQVESSQGKFAVITGSGFFPRSKETAPHRGGFAAGRSLYLLSAADGTVFDRKETTPSNDGLAEADDNCTNTAYGCTKIKNALQADPVATGPSDSRFITKTYIGDLDGNVWRFDVGLDDSYTPRFVNEPLKLASVGADQPIFSSMATVAVGTQQYLFFGTGSDLLPSFGQNTVFKLVGVLDTGTSGTQTFAHTLNSVDGVGLDEVVTAFPAVAGDIVFFTTTSLKPENVCAEPDANLYAFTFVGSAAYDATGDNKVTKNETPKVKTFVSGGRATAPFIVDQHLAMGVGGKIEMFGDPEDFNNGVGHVGVRILSWRDLR